MVIRSMWAFALGCWGVLVAMAPYLLLGFLVAGVLAVLVTPDAVRRHMGGRGFWQVVKASLLGVPLPLCSCGVIPVGVSLRSHGASRAATIGFVASTPQTGVDSIAATWSMLGWPVAVIRMTAAFVSGLVSGGLVALFDRETPMAAPASAPGIARRDWRRLWSHGFVTLPRDVAKSLLLGVAVSAAVALFVPQDALAARVTAGWGGYLLAMAIGVPIYVCSMSAIPLAASFVHLGLTPGAALVFLISGPATNAATIGALWAKVGRRATLLYLLGIAVTSLLAGWLLDTCWPDALRFVPALAGQCHEAGHQHLWRHLPALALLALLVPGLLPEREE